VFGNSLRDSTGSTLAGGLGGSSCDPSQRTIRGWVLTPKERLTSGGLGQSRTTTRACVLSVHSEDAVLTAMSRLDGPNSKHNDRSMEVRDNPKPLLAN